MATENSQTFNDFQKQDIKFDITEIKIKLDELKLLKK